MFNLVRDNKKIAQLILALCTLPFLFFGVDYVRNGVGANDLASVDKSKITPDDLQQELREQQDRLREMLGPSFDPAMMDSPEVRRMALDKLINTRLMNVLVKKEGLGVSDQQVAQLIQGIPELQENGKFSRERYEMLVKQRNTTPEAFEARLRYNLTMEQPLAAVSGGSFLAKTSSSQWLASLLEKREVSETAFSPEQYLAAVQLAPDAVKNYYESHRKDFVAPEQLRAEYLVLSQQEMASKIKVADADVSAYIHGHPERFEERRASHILIAAPKGAPEATLKAAQAKAEEVLAQVKKAPEDFAKLAKQYSQDPGSAEKGGDLGFFAHDAMVKPFADATFAMKEGKISELVRSDYGYHIIKLTGVRGKSGKALEAVKAQIADELRMEAAAKKFAEAAEAFTNTVYEQSDSLKPAADKFGLKAEPGPWIAKEQKIPGLLGNPRLLTALFSDDAVKNKRNTEAIEVDAKNHVLVAARVLEYKPAETFTLDKVAADIEKRLKRDEAAKLAVKDAEAKLAKLNAGEAPALSWSAPKTLQRIGAQGLPRASVHAIFSAARNKLPSYALANLPDGSAVIYRVGKVTPPAADVAKDGATAAMQQQYARIVAEEEFGAWLAALRQRYTVKINEKLLEAKAQQ